MQNPDRLHRVRELFVEHRWGSAELLEGWDGENLEELRELLEEEEFQVLQAQLLESARSEPEGTDPGSIPEPPPEPTPEPTMGGNVGLRRYVARVRSIVERPLSMAAQVRLIEEAAARLLEDGFELDPDDRLTPAEGYGRNLLYRDGDHGFVVVAMVWPPGTGGLPHDHGIWGVVAVTEGELEITDFEREDDGSDVERAKLVPRANVRAIPGTVTHVLPPHDDHHALRNPSEDTTAVSVHTYGRDLRECRVFDLDTQRSEVVELEYTNRGHVVLGAGR